MRSDAQVVCAIVETLRTLPTPRETLRLAGLSSANLWLTIVGLPSRPPTANSSVAQLPTCSVHYINSSLG
jgi:hypothetical protein